MRLVPNKKYLIAAILVLIFSFGIVFFVKAAGLVPCAGEKCDFCQLFVLGANIIRFLLVQLMPPVATIMIIYGAIMMIISAGNEERLKSGKKILTNAVIGIATALTGFIIVSTILNVLARNNVKIGDKTLYLEKWYQKPKCEQKSVSPPKKSKQK